MSIGSWGVVGSVSTGQLQQARHADGDRTAQEARNHSREVANAQQAEAAEGVGQMSHDEGTSDRDADGRQLWERPAKRGGAPEHSAPVTDDPPQAVDPTGNAGGNLDLLG